MRGPLASLVCTVAVPSPLKPLCTNNKRIVGVGATPSSRDRNYITVPASEVRALEALAIVHTDSVHARLKSLVITAEFVGTCETNAAVRNSSSGLSASAFVGVGIATRLGQREPFSKRVFHRTFVDVYSGDISGQDNVTLSFPFSLSLPQKTLPPSYSSPSGAISYTLKCTLTCREGMNFFKTLYETEVDVRVVLSEEQRVKMINDSSKMVSDISTSLSSSRSRGRLLSQETSNQRQPEINVRQALPATAPTPPPAPVTITVTDSEQLSSSQNVPQYSSHSYWFKNPSSSLDTLHNPLPFMSSLLSPSFSDPPNTEVSLSGFVASAAEQGQSPIMTTEQQDQLMELIKLQRAQADLSSALADMHGAVVGFQQFPLCGPREESRPHQRLATTAAIAEGGETTTASGRMSSRTSSAVQTAQQHPSPPSSAVTATIPAHFGDPGVVSGDVNAFRAVARKIRRNSSYTNGSNGCVDLETSSSDGSELAAIISTYTSPLESWTVPMVAEWAKQLGASPKSVAAFIEQDIDGVALLTLTGDDLKNELKVDALGTRRRIAVAIERLR